MYMFFETKNSITMQGDIGVAESTDQGVTWTYLGIALGEDWHVSYPYVFEYGDEVTNQSPTSNTSHQMIWTVPCVVCHS